jgi:glutamate carboxypeptidase
VTALAERLLEYAAATREETLADLAALVALDAPTGDVEALRATEDILAARLASLNGIVRRHPGPAGTHLEARFGPGDGPGILIVAHYDTVWPRGTAAARPFTVGQGVARGPGVFDMRGGLVAALRAVQGLLELGELHRPVILFLNADEESGSSTSEELILALGREARAALIPEPCLPGGGLKTARKGAGTFRFEVVGQEAHAGLAPDRGISAVHELAALVVRLGQLAQPEIGTTVNVGVIGGGSRPNVVAGSAFAEVDVRVTTAAEHERLQHDFERLTVREGATLTVRRLHARPPLERTPAISRAAEDARQIASQIGLELGEGSAGGASDGNFLALLGLPIVDGLGP